MQKRKRTKAKKSPNFWTSYFPYIEGMVIAIFAFSIFMMFVCCISFLAFSAVFKSDGHDYYAEYLTTPVDRELVNELCLNMAIPDVMGICSQPDRLIARSQINEMMQYYADQNIIYSKFTVMFGIYEIGSCYVPSDMHFYRCSYVFDGYKVFLKFNASTDELIGFG